MPGWFIYQRTFIYSSSRFAKITTPGKLSDLYAFERVRTEFCTPFCLCTHFHFCLLGRPDDTSLNEKNSNVKTLHEEKNTALVHI